MFRLSKLNPNCLELLCLFWVLAIFDLNNPVKVKNGKVGSQSLNKPVDFSNEIFFLSGKFLYSLGFQ